MIWKIYFVNEQGQRSSAGVELGATKQAAMDSASQKGVRNVVDAIPL
jgi:hypothetical protein